MKALAAVLVVLVLAAGWVAGSGLSVFFERIIGATS